MDGTPPYRVIDQSIGMDTLALHRFGGALGDPVVAWILVSGTPVLQVVAPAGRHAWDSAQEERFRLEVREIAATHHLYDHHGPVSVLFDPPQTDLIAAKDIPEGEPIDRKR